MYKRILLLLVFVFFPAFAFAENVTVGCDQSLQIQPIITGSISGGTCTVSASPYIDFLVNSNQANQWITVPPNSQPATHRSVASNVSYTLTCQNGAGSDISSQPVVASFQACPASPQQYSCGSGGNSCAACGGASQPACVGTNYTTSNCNSMCSGAPATPMYTCSGSSCVRDDTNGFTTDSNCNNSCVVTPKYLCSGSSCVRDDTNGVTTSSNCDNSCNASQATCSISVTPNPGASSSPATINWTYNRNGAPARSDMVCQFTSPQNASYNASTNPPFFSVASSPTANGTKATLPLKLGTNQFNASCDTFGGTPNALNKALCNTSVQAVGSGTCNNGILEGAEQCDNGSSNGALPAVCSTSCTWNSGGPCGGSCSSQTFTDVGFNQVYSKSLSVPTGTSVSLYWFSQKAKVGSCVLKETSNGATWATTENTSGTTNVGIPGIGTHTYIHECRNKDTNAIVDSNVATLTVTGSCGNAICDSGETCSSCPGDCGACVDNSSCNADFTITPSHVLTGKPFTGSVTVRNIGTTNWVPNTYSFKSTSATNWGITKVDLPGQVNGQPTVGSNVFVMNATAPATAGNYQFTWQMQKNSTTFGDICTPPGGITVYKPQCDNGTDDDTPKDGKIDCADPQCLNQSGVCNKECDDETNGCGASLSLYATPPLVRNGASATLNWSISNYAGNCSLVGPGILPTTVTPGVGRPSKIINNITEKRTYYLTCGGLQRSATISVIKFVEARPGDISHNQTDIGQSGDEHGSRYACATVGKGETTGCIEDPFGEFTTSDCDGMCFVGGGGGDPIY